MTNEPNLDTPAPARFETQSACLALSLNYGEFVPEQGMPITSLVAKPSEVKAENQFPAL